MVFRGGSTKPKRLAARRKAVTISCRCAWSMGPVAKAAAMWGYICPVTIPSPLPFRYWRASSVASSHAADAGNLVSACAMFDALPFTNARRPFRTLASSASVRLTLTMKGEASGAISRRRRYTSTLVRGMCQCGNATGADLSIYPPVAVDALMVNNYKNPVKARILVDRAGS